MLIPLGSEDNSLRRAPLVTFVWIGLCFVPSVLFRLAPIERDTNRNQALAYYLAHPYLALDMRFGMNLSEEERAAIAEKVEKPDSDVFFEQQQKLDRLTEDYFEGWNQRRERRFGVLADTFGGFQTLVHVFVTPGMILLLTQLMFVYMSGPFLEDLWGRRLFSLLLLGLGPADGIGAFLFSSREAPPLLGITGATAGLLAAYVFQFPQRKMHVLLTFGRLFSRDFWTPSWMVGLCWLVGSAFLLLVETFVQGAYRQISFGGLLGAIAWGVGVAGVVKHWQLAARFHPSPRDLMPPEQRLSEEIEEALRLSKKEEALALLARAHREFPNDLDFHRRYWEQLVRTERKDGRQIVGTRLVDALLEAGENEAAYFTWMELAKNSRTALPLQLGLRLAKVQLAADCRSQARELLQGLWMNWNPAVGSEAFFLWVGEMAKVDERLCLQAIRQAQASLSFTGQERESLRVMEAQLATRVKPEENHEAQSIEVAALPPIPGLAEGINPFKPTRITKLKVTPVVLAAMDADGLFLRAGDQERHFAWIRFKSLAFGLIHPIGDEKTALLDLFLNSPLEEGPQHSLLRLESRHLAEAEGDTEAASEKLQGLAIRIAKLARLDPLTTLEDQVFSLASHHSPQDFEQETYGTHS